METVTAFQSSFGNASCMPPNWAARSGLGRCVSVPVLSKSGFFQCGIQRGPSISHLKLGRRMNVVSRKRIAIRASMQPPDSDDSAARIAPLQLESPIGQFLSQILVSHPHLVPAAVEQQLEQFQSDRDTEDKEGPAASGSELVLYRRIAEVKSNERKKALEEMLYALVVQKFMDANVHLIPSITPSSNSSGQIDNWPSQEGKLENAHSPEAYEMIQNHLALILGNRLNDSYSIAEISKLKVGQVYAASVMYGYFLRRIDQRFQLEKSMKILPQGIDKEDTNTGRATGEEDTKLGAESSNEPLGNLQPHPEVSPTTSGLGGMKTSRLRSYVMSLDGETLQRYATIRSKEAISIIEKHTEALFGRPNITISPQGSVNTSKGEEMKISFGGLKRLVLEAVTFGSFLWDVESYVDARYHFV